MKSVLSCVLALLVLLEADSKTAGRCESLLSVGLGLHSELNTRRSAPSRPPNLRHDLAVLHGLAGWHLIDPNDHLVVLRTGGTLEQLP
jgi:hypothetical protein